MQRRQRGEDFSLNGACEEEVVSKLQQLLLRLRQVEHHRSAPHAAQPLQLHVNLLDCRVSSQGMHLVVALLRAPLAGVRSLLLPRCGLGNSSVNSMKIFGEALAANTTLETLSLADNSLEPSHVEAVARSLRLHPSLKKLDLTFNEVGLRGGWALSDTLLTNTILSELNLTYEKATWWQDVQDKTQRNREKLRLLFETASATKESKSDSAGDRSLGKKAGGDTDEEKRPALSNRRSSSTYTFSRPRSIGSLDISEKSNEDESPPQSPGRARLLFPSRHADSQSEVPSLGSPRKLFSAYSDPMPSARGTKPTLASGPPLLSSSSPSKGRKFRRKLSTLSIEDEMENVKQITQILSTRGSGGDTETALSLESLPATIFERPPSLHRAQTTSDLHKPGAAGSLRSSHKLARSTEVARSTESGLLMRESLGSRRLSQSVDFAQVRRENKAQFDAKKLQFAVEQLQLRLKAELTDKERRIKRLNRELNEETHRLLSLQAGFKRSKASLDDAQSKNIMLSSRVSQLEAELLHEKRHDETQAQLKAQLEEALRELQKERNMAVEKNIEYATQAGQLSEKASLFVKRAADNERKCEESFLRVASLQKQLDDSTQKHATELEKDRKRNAAEVQRYRQSFELTVTAQCKDFELRIAILEETRQKYRQLLEHWMQTEQELIRSREQRLEAAEMEELRQKKLEREERARQKARQREAQEAEERLKRAQFEDVVAQMAAEADKEKGELAHKLAEEKRRNAMILEDMRQTHRIAMTAVKAQAAQIRKTMMDEEDEQVRKEKQHANTLADELKAQRIVWETQEKKRKSMLQEAKDALQQSMEDSKRQHEMYLAEEKREAEKSLAVWRKNADKARKQHKEAEERAVKQEKERSHKEFETLKEMAREAERLRQESRKRDLEKKAKMQKVLEEQNAIMQKKTLERFKREDEARQFARQVKESLQIPKANQMRSMSQLVFARYDQEETGSISTDKLRVMCYDYGYYLDELQFQAAIKSLDTNSDGMISYADFIVWWRSSSEFKNLQLGDKDISARQKAIELFHKHDRKQTGSIPESQWPLFAQELFQCEIVSDTDMSEEELLVQLDTDGNGVVSFNEYISWLHELNTFDPEATGALSSLAPPPSYSTHL